MKAATIGRHREARQDRIRTVEQGQSLSAMRPAVVRSDEREPDLGRSRAPTLRLPTAEEAMAKKHPDVSPAVVARLRRICLRLPGACEEPAWVGTRWSVRKKVFAHVLHVEAGWPPAYARAVGLDGPMDLLTFRSPAAECNVYAFAAPPFFRPGWWPNIVGMLLADGAPAVGQTLPATPGQFGMFAVPEVAVVFKGSST